MSVQIQRHNEVFSTAGQLDEDDLQAIAAAGYRSLICNRPDGEGGPQQASSGALASAAQRLGMQFIYLPVVAASRITDADVRAFGELLATLPKPILAYCRSGNRSSILYQRAQDEAAMP